MKKHPYFSGRISPLHGEGRQFESVRMYQYIISGISSFGRADACQASGSRFEPDIPLQRK